MGGNTLVYNSCRHYGWPSDDYAIDVASSAWLGSLVWTCNIGLIVGRRTRIAARDTAEGLMGYEFDRL